MHQPLHQEVLRRLRLNRPETVRRWRKEGTLEANLELKVESILTATERYKESGMEADLATEQAISILTCYVPDPGEDCPETNGLALRLQ